MSTPSQKIVPEQMVEASTTPSAPLPELASKLVDLSPREQAVLVNADQRMQWALGNQIRIEAYLAVLPALAAEPSLVADLALQELILASERGFGTNIEHVAVRFPSCSEQIRKLGNRWLSLTDATRSARSASSDLVGYEILGELGRGGMGVVYKARHRRLNRLAALKMILGGAHIGSANRLRFLAEAQALAQLNHPHIVRVYESGELDGCPYIALELVEGGNLADRLRGKRMTDDGGSGMGRSGGTRGGRNSP